MTTLEINILKKVACSIYTVYPLLILKSFYSFKYKNLQQKFVAHYFTVYFYL